MSQFGGVERPGPWETAGDHERRIRALEALQPCCGDSGNAFLSYRDCVLQNANLFAYWPMDEPSGDLTDLVNGYVFVHTPGFGSPITWGEDGPFAAAFPSRTSVGFSGTFGPTGNDDCFLFNAPTEASDIFGGTNPWTVEAWTNPEAVSASFTERIWQNWDPLAGAGTILAVDLGPTGVTDGYNATRNSTVVEQTGSPTLDSWIHVRVTYDGATMSLFLNGVLVDTAATAATFSTGGDWVLGNANPVTNFAAPFQGRISDFAVYDDALTEFCATVTPSGPGQGGSAADEFMVLTADGQGGTYWAYPTIEVLEDGV